MINNLKKQSDFYSIDIYAIFSDIFKTFKVFYGTKKLQYKDNKNKLIKIESLYNEFMKIYTDLEKENIILNGIEDSLKYAKKLDIINEKIERI
ncbi:MAG TPA: hypothetical protein ENK67_00470 [Flavobacteriia bacterium]|nr:hypothetical protein [Flavobacteriia bacterium]